MAENNNNNNVVNITIVVHGDFVIGNNNALTINVNPGRGRGAPPPPRPPPVPPADRGPGRGRGRGAVPPDVPAPGQRDPVVVNNKRGIVVLGDAHDLVLRGRVINAYHGEEGIYAYIWDSFGELTTFVQFGGKIRFYCGCPPGKPALGFWTPGPDARVMRALSDGGETYWTDDLTVNAFFQMGYYECRCEGQLKEEAERFTLRIRYRTCNITESITYRKNCIPDEKRWSICVKTEENVGEAIDNCTYLTPELCEDTHDIEKQVIDSLLCLNGMLYTLCDAYALEQGGNWDHFRTYSVDFIMNRSFLNCKSSMRYNRFFDVFALNQSVVSRDQERLSCAQLSQVKGALVRLEYGSIWRSLEGALRFCFVCNVVEQKQQTNVSRKLRSRPESTDLNSLSCDRDGYANGSFNMSHTVTSGRITLQLISWDNLEIQKNFRFVSTELLVNLTPNDRCGRIRQLICQYDLSYDTFNFYSKINWKFNGVPLKRSDAKIHREGVSLLSIRKPGNYVCTVETLFNMAETREIIRDENYAFILVSKSCLAPSVQKKDSGILIHVFIACGIIMVALVAVLIMNILYQRNAIGVGQNKRRPTYNSTSKTASISPRSVNIEKPKSPPISTKSKSKTST